MFHGPLQRVVRRHSATAFGFRSHAAMFEHGTLTPPEILELRAPVRDGDPMTKIVPLERLMRTTLAGRVRGEFRHRPSPGTETPRCSKCLLTTELSGRPPPLCRGQTRPTIFHGPLERVVRRHSASP